MPFSAISVRAWGTNQAFYGTAIDLVFDLIDLFALDINLVDEACVIGRIVDENGSPKSGVNVEVGIPALDMELEGLTDRGGYFAVGTWVIAEVYRLLVTQISWLGGGSGVSVLSMGQIERSTREAVVFWLALAVALVAAWPRDDRSFGTWVTLAGSAILAMLMTASALPTVNVLAVAVVLAAVAHTARGLTGRVAIITALAAVALALCRFACDSIPTFWLVGDTKGWLLGRLVGWLVCPGRMALETELIFVINTHVGRNIGI